MHDSIIGAAAVALGAAVGGPARFFVSGLIARRIGETFPWGTMAVNVSGAFVIGVVAACAEHSNVSNQSPLWLLLVTGILGSYTTVSSFSLQTRALVREGEPLRGLGNAASSIGLSVGAAACGYALAMALFGSAPV